MEQARKDASKGVVVGMAALTGETRERKDIDTFIAEDEDGFNLLLLALSKMQNVPDALTKAEKDPATKSKMQQAPTKLGYFALAGKSTCLVCRRSTMLTNEQVSMVFQARLGIVWTESSEMHSEGIVLTVC